MPQKTKVESNSKEKILQLYRATGESIWVGGGVVGIAQTGRGNIRIKLIRHFMQQKLKSDSFLFRNAAPVL